MSEESSSKLRYKVLHTSPTGSIVRAKSHVEGEVEVEKFLEAYSGPFHMGLSSLRPGSMVSLTLQWGERNMSGDVHPDLIGAIRDVCAAALAEIADQKSKALTPQPIEQPLPREKRVSGRSRKSPSE